nr:MAG TPA: hypothetical protein [Caudoviricetes sp.]
MELILQLHLNKDYQDAIYFYHLANILITMLFSYLVNILIIYLSNWI